MPRRAPTPPDPSPPASPYRIARYKRTRHWAVYEGDVLVVVTVYKRGAAEVVRRLDALPSPRPTWRPPEQLALWSAPDLPPP